MQFNIAYKVFPPVSISTYISKILNQLYFHSYVGITVEENPPRFSEFAMWSFAVI